MKVLKKTTITTSLAGVSLMMLFNSVALAELPARWDIVRLGYFDADHTASSGQQYSDYRSMNSNGQVAGFSYRYDGATSTGRTLWLQDASSRVRLGLYDAEHTGSGGQQTGYINYLDDHGNVAGISHRYSGSNLLGQSAWYYNGASTRNIGLIDSEHTRASDGYRHSGYWGHNDNRNPLGHSQRFDANANAIGQSAWSFDGTTTHRIGFYDAAHTDSAGYQASTIQGRTQQGVILGISEMSGGFSSMRGNSLWVSDGVNTTKIGLTDAEHTGSLGVHDGSFGTFSEGGHIFGHSERFDGLSTKGQSAWVYDGVSTKRIGLTGPNFVNFLGTMDSTVYRVNAHNQATGVSREAGTRYGNAAWFYDGNTTRKVGLYNGAHSAIDGTQYVNPIDINDNGQVIGSSSRYKGSNHNGISVWIYRDGVTARLGFTGAAYTRDDGYQYSRIYGFNELGQVLGGSARYAGANNLGQAAWVDTDGVITRVGLVDAEHTRDDGRQFSSGEALNDQGQAVGISTRYGGGSSSGSSGWAYDSQTGTTVEIGLNGADYTRNDGFQSTIINDLNTNGQAIGESRRFVDDSLNSGRVAWLYDFGLEQTFELTLSESANGDAESIIYYFDNSGIVLGRYDLYNGATFVGERAFYFSIDDGLWDLGTLLGLGGVDVQDNGWAGLARALETDDLTHILGFLDLGAAAGDRALYLMSASPVPVPAAAWLFATAILSCCGMKRRSTH